MKFNVGDKVKLVGDPMSTFGKDKHFGKIATIRCCDTSQPYPYLLSKPVGYRWRESEFKPVKNDKIVVTHDGKTTTATLYRENGSKEVATAKCSPEDTFDFNIGATLAMERLVGTVEKPEPPKPKYYNGKVVCIKSPYSWWTVGKVYEVKDGHITADDGDLYPSDSYEPYIDAEDVRHAGCANGTKHNMENEFIPYVE